MSTDTKENTWMQEARDAAWVQESSAMNELPIVKVYNKPMWRGVEDMVKSGKIIIKRNWWEFEVLWDEMKLNILLVRKFYTGFVPRIDEFWDIKKDENQHVIKDFYYTPEVDVFSKDNIALWIQRKWWGREILGKAPKLNFDTYCKSPKVDWAINPLFKEVKTNEQTWERYTTSYMKLWYTIYAQDLDTKEIYKIIPWGSYGRFNDIVTWTFEDLKLKARTRYKEENDTMVINSFINSKVWVRIDWSFSYLDWQLDWFIQEDNRPQVQEINDLVIQFNKERFPWLDFDKPLEFFEYKRWLSLWTWSEAQAEPNDSWEISIENIPF